jgi:succinate dehydrogenase / fumarate reductase, iron-sulfur subunit
MNIVLEIERSNAETGRESKIQTYTVSVDPADRVLDALVTISRTHDGTVSFRKSCAHGVCGSDAMRINGIERLACRTLIQDVAQADGDVIRVEPLQHLPVQRDLMVDQSEFFRKFRDVKPFFIPKAAPVEKEFIQTQEDRASIDDATKCIHCGACYSACPVLEKNPDFIGPAAIVAAARFVFDSRDQGLEPRIDILDHPDGVWACENHFECTRVCPREIKVTKLINLTKREIKRYREKRGESTRETHPEDTV